jgi:hypothetical protein
VHTNKGSGMSLKFEMVVAGQYNINQNNKMIGLIKKENASKWIMYKATNASVLGKPVAVAKTLKALKTEAETLFVSTDTNYQGNLDSSIKTVQDAKSERYDLMKEMLERDTVIKFEDYTIDFDDYEVQSEPEFLTPEQVAYL